MCCGRFQCVELVERYLYVAEHWGALAGDGADMARIYGAAQSITPVPNGTAGQAPQVGDVISFSVESDFTDDDGFYPGHTAIVAASDVNTTTGLGSITILSENWSGTAKPTTLTYTSPWTVPAIQTDNGNDVLVSTPYAEWLPLSTPPLGPPPPTATGVPPPTGGTSPNLSSAACPSATSCVAAGYYADGGYYQPLLVTGAGTSWTATAPPLPANASPGGVLQSVACPSASACVAVGLADVPGGYGGEGLLVTGSGTSWQAAAAPVPADAATSLDSQLSAVACYSATSCAATGTFEPTSSASGDGMLLTGSGVSWTATAAPVPANAGPDPRVQLQAVACPSASACVAVGQYTDPTSGYAQGLLLTGSGASWTATAAPLPANAAANPDVQLYAVACHSATSCVATGSYQDSSGNTQGLLVTGSGTSWKATEAPLPADAAANPEAALASVACPSATACVAASWYVDSSGNYHGVLVTGSKTSWKATEAPLPADAAIPNAQLISVACHSATSCAAAGDYRDSSGNYQGLLVNGSGTSWQATEAPLPANAAPPADLQRVACPSTTWCMADGGYEGDLLVVTGL